MTLYIGAILRGVKHDFRLIERLGDKTVINHVFKAEVIPRSQHNLPSKPWVVVKSVDLNNHAQINTLKREYHYYQQPTIASSKYIRGMYDTLNDQTDWTTQKPFCLAFEWMDTTMAEVSSESHSQNSVLMASI